MTIATLGPAGTFSHEATESIFPTQPVVFFPNFDALFDALGGNETWMGVVPLENSLHGSVHEILDLLRETSVRLWRAHELRIRHAFGARNPSRVSTVASHPQALRQSRTWLRKHYPNAFLLPTTSTAAAVDTALGDENVAAIASEKLLRASGLTIVSSDIEGTENTTRFGIVAVSDPFPGSKRTRMSIALHPKKAQDQPGLLHRLLTPFKVYDINLTRIENRPTGVKLGDYNFFIDFEGAPDEARTKQVLSELQELADIRILGEW